MGMCFNPSNDGFWQALRSRIYVDETGMIEFFNRILDTEQKFAVSRAIRLYCFSFIRELDSGKGFADMVYLPKAGCPYPALLIELKCNESIETALKQIKEKRYNGRRTPYMDNLLLVAINYDKQNPHLQHQKSS